MSIRQHGAQSGSLSRHVELANHSAALIRKGLTREQAYELVQRNAMKTGKPNTRDERCRFLKQLLTDPSGKTLRQRRTRITLLVGLSLQRVNNRFAKLGL